MNKPHLKSVTSGGVRTPSALFPLPSVDTIPVSSLIDMGEERDLLSVETRNESITITNPTFIDGPREYAVVSQASQFSISKLFESTFFKLVLSEGGVKEGKKLMSQYQEKGSLAPEPVKEMVFQLDDDYHELTYAEFKEALSLYKKTKT
jgi:hypothetical protein